VIRTVCPISLEYWNWWANRVFLTLFIAAVVRAQTV